jgi:hypothetical protein
MPKIKMNINIKVRCSECGVLLVALTDTTAGPPAITVDPHVCSKPVPKDIHCTLSMALDRIGAERVEVNYWKKNGEFRTLTGYFPGERALNAKLGYVFFLEDVAGCWHPKNLIRTSISQIEIAGEELVDSYIIH